MKQITLLTGVALSVAVRPIGAAILYDTGPFTAEGGAYSSELNSNQVADDFLLLSPSQITIVNWWGKYRPGNTPQGPDAFRLRIFQDLSGTPSSVPLFQISLGDVGRVNTGVISLERDVYAYSGLLPSPVTLEAETRYWLSIDNNTSSDADDDWYWQRVTSSAGEIQVRGGDGGSWLLRSESTMAFTLEGVVVPEPSTWGLLALVGASLAFTVRKRQ